MKVVLVGTFSGGFKITAYLMSEPAEHLARALRMSGKMAEAVEVEAPVGAALSANGIDFVMFGNLAESIRIVGPFENHDAALDYAEEVRCGHDEFLICTVNEGSNREVLPGATASEIIEVMMQDVVGDYAIPKDVPEWNWVEAKASFAHTSNGRDGVWEFVLNLANAEFWTDIPEKLAPVIKKAIDNGVAYVLVHQGT